MATDHEPEPEDYERMNQPLRGEYFTGDPEQPRQYCVWECVDTPNAARPRGRVPKPSCGSLGITYTAKHWGHHDWQGVCSICGKKPRLDEGRILAAFTLRHDAQMFIHRFHSCRRFNQIYIRFWKEFPVNNECEWSAEEKAKWMQFLEDNKSDWEMLMHLYAQGDLDGYQQLINTPESHWEDEWEMYVEMFNYRQMSFLNKYDKFESCEGNVRPLRRSTWGI